MGIEALLSTQVIDTTTVGRAVMTAADAAAARAAIGAGTSSFSGAYSALSGIPSTFAPSAHKTSHATGGSDALTAADIGAAATSHTHAAADITSGIIATARLASGTADATKYLRGDQTWQTIAAGGISSLNALTDATQTFATGTTGTNFGIVSAAGVHTFNLPDASTTARGLVTTGTQTFAGAKTFSTKVTVPATGNTSGGIGNGANGIDFFGGVYTYVQGGGYPTYTSAQSFRLGQNVRIEWSGTDNDAYTSPNTRIERWESGHVSVRLGVTSCKFSVTNAFTDVSNYERAILQFVTYASARYVQLAAESAGTGIANMNLVLSPKGTGALIAGPAPDGTTTGGNARGQYAVDLQLYRASASQVASGQDSFVAGYGCTASNQGSICIGYASTSSGIRSICIGDQSQATGIQSIAMGGGGAVASSIGSIAIGYYCTASGGTAFSVGQQNLASAARSVATGLQSLANKHGQRAHAAGSFTDASQSGQAQCVEMVLRNKTTDGTTAVTLFLDGVSARLTVASGRILHATAQIVGSKSDGTAVATYMRKFAIKNVGGTTTLVGSVETIGTDVAAGTSLSITADDVNDAVNPAVIGVAGETWRWVMTVYGVELAYGT